MAPPSEERRKRGLDGSCTHPAAAILAIIALHVGASAAWMYRNGFFDPKRPPFNDCAWFRLDAYAIQRAMAQEGFVGLLKSTLAHDRPHPPILHALNAVAGLPIGGIEVWTQWCVQAFYLAGLVLALYLLGREVLGTSGRAVAYSLFAAAAPVYIASARVALPKFPMMVMVFFALHALLRSEMFARRGWSTAFGFWTGLGLLTMMLAPIYLAGSALAALVIGLHRGPRGRVCANAALALVTAAGIAATWYAGHWRRVAEYAALVTSEEGQRYWSAGAGMWSLWRWAYYPIQLVNNGLGFFLASAVVLVVLVSVAARPRNAQAPGKSEPRPWNGWILAIGALVSLPIVARGQIAAESQYIMNLPALTLLFAHARAHALAGARLRRIALGLLAAGSLVSASLTFRRVDRDVTPEPANRWVIQMAGLPDVFIVGSMDTYGGSPARQHHVSPTPGAEYWPLEEIVDSMEKHRSFPEIRLAQIIGARSAYVNVANLQYVAWRRGYHMQILNTPGFPPYRALDLVDLARRSEFLVTDPVFRAGYSDVALAENSAFAGLRASGLTFTRLLRQPVNRNSTIVLFQLRLPRRAPAPDPRPSRQEKREASESRRR